MSTKLDQNVGWDTCVCISFKVFLNRNKNFFDMFIYFMFWKTSRTLSYYVVSLAEDPMSIVFVKSFWNENLICSTVLLVMLANSCLEKYTLPVSSNEEFLNFYDFNFTIKPFKNFKNLWNVKVLKKIFFEKNFIILW